MTLRDVPPTKITARRKLLTLIVGPLCEGCRESRRYSRDTYPESYITKYTSIRRQKKTDRQGVVAYHASWRARRACRSQTSPRSCLRLMDSCITQLKAQGPSRTCNERKEEEEEDVPAALPSLRPPGCNENYHTITTKITTQLQRKLLHNSGTTSVRVVTFVGRRGWWAYRASWRARRV